MLSRLQTQSQSLSLVVPYTSFPWVRYHLPHMKSQNCYHIIIKGRWIVHVYPFWKHTQYKLHSQTLSGRGEQSEVSCLFLVLVFNKSIMTLQCLHRLVLGFGPGDKASAGLKIGKILFWRSKRFVFQERGTSNCVKTMPNKAEIVRTL